MGLIRRFWRLLSLPLRAPMLLLLAAVAAYEGLRWGVPAPSAGDPGALPVISWWVDCLHALLVVVICTMPTLLLQRVSSLMAMSRVMSLVISLLLVTVGGLYLLQLNVLSNVVLLAAAVLLARLDLVRIRVSPPPLQQALGLGLLVLVAASVGRQLAGV